MIKPPPAAPPFHFPIPAYESNPKAFTFAVSPLPAMALTFPPRPTPPHAQKRYRALTDVDGERSCLRKKKRRLRLFLITSRLSLPFSQPATNIIDRGNSKIAVWAKQKALGRNLLRKAAILNRIKRQCLHIKGMDQGGLGRTLLDQEEEQTQFELAKLEFIYGSHDTHTRPILRRISSYSPNSIVRTGLVESKPSKPPIQGTPVPTPPSPSPSEPDTDDEDDQESSTYRSSPNDAYSYDPPCVQIPRRNYIPLPPSPLGLSNYDALDLEDDIPDRYADLDDDDDDGPSASLFAPISTAGVAGNDDPAKTPPQAIYSDFNILDPDEPVVGDYDGVDGEEGCEPVWPTIPNPSPEAKKVLPVAVAAPVSLPSAVTIPALSIPFHKNSYHGGIRDGMPPSPPPTSHSPNFPPLDGVGARYGQGRVSAVDYASQAAWTYQNSWPPQLPLPGVYHQNPGLFRRDSFPGQAVINGTMNLNLGPNSGLARRREAENKEERERRGPNWGLGFQGQR